MIPSGCVGATAAAKGRRRDRARLLQDPEHARVVVRPERDRVGLGGRRGGGVTERVAVHEVLVLAQNHPRRAVEPPAALVLVGAAVLAVHRVGLEAEDLGGVFDDGSEIIYDNVNDMFGNSLLGTFHHQLIGKVTYTDK